MLGPSVKRIFYECTLYLGSVSPLMCPFTCKAFECLNYLALIINHAHTNYVMGFSLEICEWWPEHTYGLIVMCMPWCILCVVLECLCVILNLKMHASVI